MGTDGCRGGSNNRHEETSLVRPKILARSPQSPPRSLEFAPFARAPTGTDRRRSKACLDHLQAGLGVRRASCCRLAASGAAWRRAGTRVRLASACNALRFSRMDVRRPRRALTTFPPRGRASLWFLCALPCDQAAPKGVAKAATARSPSVYQHRRVLLLVGEAQTRLRKGFVLTTPLEPREVRASSRKLPNPTEGLRGASDGRARLLR